MKELYIFHAYQELNLYKFEKKEFHDKKRILDELFMNTMTSIHVAFLGYWDTKI